MTRSASTSTSAANLPHIASTSNDAAASRREPQKSLTSIRDAATPVGAAIPLPIPPHTGSRATTSLRLPDTGPVPPQPARYPPPSRRSPPPPAAAGGAVRTCRRRGGRRHWRRSTPPPRIPPPTASPAVATAHKRRAASHSSSFATRPAATSAEGVNESSAAVRSARPAGWARLAQELQADQRCEVQLQCHAAQHNALSRRPRKAYMAWALRVSHRRIH